jgi:DNA-binding protein YbaB
MKKIDKDFEKLSAYIDGELNVAEKNELEEKLALSKDLQAKLNELRKLKELTVSSVKPVKESPYFVTRLMAGLSTENRWTKKLKTFAPAAGLIVLTAAVMVLLKFNPKVIDDIVEQQKENIAGFYTENLKPLLFAGDLSNEDIFNFAFYKQLPIDPSNTQTLHLGYDESGKEFFEIKTAPAIDKKDNFEKFVSALELNEAQKKQVDSILNFYKEELQTQILVNDKNTVAINPNLWNYNTVIAADLIAFAESVNKEQFEIMIPQAYTFKDKDAFKKILQDVKTRSRDEYIFLTPDTIFTEPFKFDKEKFKAENERLKEEMKRVGKELERVTVTLRLDSNLIRLKQHPKKRTGFQVYIDSNICRVELDRTEFPRIVFPDFDSIAANIEEAAKHFKNFSITIPKPPKVRSKVGFNFKIESDDSAKIFDFNFKIPDPDSIMKFESFMRDSVFKLYGKNFYFNSDSLIRMMNRFYKDSSEYFRGDEFRKEMKEFQKNFQEEMKKLQEELRKLRIEIKKDSANVEVIDIIEI